MANEITSGIDPTSNLGPDATATFDNGPSNPTEHASSEALNSVTDEGRDGEEDDRDEGDTGENELDNTVDEAEEDADEAALDDKTL